MVHGKIIEWLTEKRTTAVKKRLYSSFRDDYPFHWGTYFEDYGEGYLPL